MLALVHGANVPPGTFGEEVERRGHQLDVWSLAWGTPPPRPIDDYAAVLVLGGAMHADQDDRHPWLREETFFLERLLDLHVPLLGVCLGSQLIARAAHAPVRRCSQPEVGWVEVELTSEAADDPLFAPLPSRFLAFQWHFYEHGLPPGALELARSRVCTQAFRLGDAVWGVQFHPEVTQEVIDCWIEEAPEEVPCPPEELRHETSRNLEGWQEIGRALCGAFLDVAERARVPA